MVYAMHPEQNISIHVVGVKINKILYLVQENQLLINHQIQMLVN